MTGSLKGTNLFKPIKLGNIELSHRVVFAPTTRLRNDPVTNVPNVELASEYFSQRSERPGSLIITEGLVVGEKDGGFYPGFGGVWNDAQIEGWSKIFNAVHKNKSFIVAQLFHLGRQGFPAVLAERGFPYRAPSAIYIEKNPDAPDFKKTAEESNNPLRPYTLEEIKELIEEFVTASKNIINAGADGVEVHVANGYLLNQFFDPASNQRTDKYGGSVENRARITLEIIDRLIEEIGAEKTSIRLSPYGIFGDLKGALEDPSLIDDYTYLVKELQKRADQGHVLQYVHLVEPRLDNANFSKVDTSASGASNDFIAKIWKGKIIKAGNYANDNEAIIRAVQDDRVLIAIGRHYISNPDLPDRLENGYPLAEYDRSTFYTGGSKGYTDYPRYSKEA